MPTIIVFGGTGFLGRRLVRRFAAEGATVTIGVRHPDQARSDLRAAGLDQGTVFRADVQDRASVVATVAGADAVVNAVSAYVEKGNVTFEAMHEQAPDRRVEPRPTAKALTKRNCAPPQHAAAIEERADVNLIRQHSRP